MLVKEWWFILPCIEIEYCFIIIDSAVNCDIGQLERDSDGVGTHALFKHFYMIELLTFI